MGLLASLKGALGGKSKPADEELDRNVEEEIARHLLGGYWTRVSFRIKVRCYST